MVAEERITTKFSGLVGAYGSEEEATFLATQQVDEARHMQFYARFQDEVVADPATIAAHVERAREQLSPTRSGRSSTRRSSRPTSGSSPSPADLAAKVAFVTIYHLILESDARADVVQVHHRLPRARGAAARLRRRLLEDPPRRDAPHRLRRLVPARGRPRRSPSSADVVRADAARAAARRSPSRSRRPDRERHRLGRARRERATRSATSRSTGSPAGSTSSARRC